MSLHDIRPGRGLSADAKVTVGSIMDIVAQYYFGAPSVGGMYLIRAGTREKAQKAADDAARRAHLDAISRAAKADIRGTTETQFLAFGRQRIGGVVCALGNDNADNKIIYLGLAHTLSHAGGCQGWVSIYIDEELINTGTEITGDGVTTDALVTKAKFVSGGTNMIKFRHYKGTATQTADATLTANLPNALSTDYRRGVQWTRVTLTRVDDQEAFQTAFPNGAPNISFELDTNLCYDPRGDSTNGGSGSQRIADPTSWVFSRNTAVIAATYMLMAQTDGGMGVPSSSLNAAFWASVAAAANICDEATSEYTPRYRCDIVLDTSDSYENNLRRILDCMRGELVTIGGSYKMYAGAYRSPTFTLDESYLRGTVVTDPLAQLDTLYNAIRPIYIDSTQNYRTLEAPLNTNSTYETQDGGTAGPRRLWKELNLPGVTNSRQAQYLAQIESRISRKQKTIKVPCTLKALDIECWETGTITLTEPGVSGVFRCMLWEWDGQGPVLTFREETSDLYTVASTTAPGVPTVPAAGYETPATITGLAAAAAPDGIMLTWTAMSRLCDRIEVSSSMTSGGSLTVIGYVDGKATSYLDRNVSGATLFYKLRGRNKLGPTFGAYSSEVSATAKQAADTGIVMAVNAGFEGGATGWVLDAGSIDNSLPRTGSWNFTLPGTGSTQNVAATNNKRVPISPGDTVLVAGWLRSTASANGTGKAAARFYDSSGTYLSDVTAPAVSPGTTYTQSAGTLTAPASAAYVSAAFIINSFSSSSSEKWYCDDMVMAVTPKQPYNLTVAGSGQRLGDQRNEPAITALNRTPAIPQSAPVGTTGCSNSAGGTVTITISNFTLQVGSNTINYTGGTKTTNDTTFPVGTVVYIYCDDPTYAGGAVTYTLTSVASTVAANDGRFFVDQVTIPARGGSGGGNQCVALEMFLGDGQLARDAKVGDMVRVMTDDGQFLEAEIDGLSGYRLEPCVRIEVAGAAVVVSEFTPCTLMTGESVLAKDLEVGYSLAVRIAGADSWEPITAIASAGMRTVARLHVGGRSYAAGEAPDRLIYTHNPSKP